MISPFKDLEKLNLWIRINSDLNIYFFIEYLSKI